MKKTNILSIMEDYGPPNPFEGLCVSLKDLERMARESKAPYITYKVDNRELVVQLKTLDFEIQEEHFNTINEMINPEKESHHFYWLGIE